MRSNVVRNFGGDLSGDVNDSNRGGNSMAERENDPSDFDSTLRTVDGKAKGTASSRVLRWGVPEDYEGAPYNVIIGADIVASLYGECTKLILVDRSSNCHFSSLCHAAPSPVTENVICVFVRRSGRASPNTPRAQWAQHQNLHLEQISIGSPARRIRYRTETSVCFGD